jgi:hypothetical protein
LKDEEEEGENEFEEDNVIVPLKPLVSKRMKRLGKNKEGRRKSADDWTKEPAPISESVAEIGSVVYCSICERSISVPMKDGNADVDLDEYLCRHMSTCRGITNNLRSSRSGGGKRQISWDPAVDTDTHHQHEDMNCVKGEDENTMGGDPIHEINVDQTEEEPIFEREISIDDWDENNYEDRVDEWIEVTLKQMKKSLAEEEKPVPVMFPGGLFVPSWVNKKLFSYQRTGLRWMWELYQQGAGGIVGDEMASPFLSCFGAAREARAARAARSARVVRRKMVSIGPTSTASLARRALRLAAIAARVSICRPSSALLAKTARAHRPASRGSSLRRSEFGIGSCELTYKVQPKP